MFAETENVIGFDQEADDNLLMTAVTLTMLLLLLENILNSTIALRCWQMTTESSKSYCGFSAKYCFKLLAIYVHCILQNVILAILCQYEGVYTIKSY